MIESAGKQLERLFLVIKYLDDIGQRSENQPGFRCGSFTEDALDRVLQAARGAAIGAVQHCDIWVVVSLDSRNAFNSAPWRKMNAALRKKKVVLSPGQTHPGGRKTFIAQGHKWRSTGLGPRPSTVERFLR